MTELDNNERRSRFIASKNFWARPCFPYNDPDIHAPQALCPIKGGGE